MGESRRQYRVIRRDRSDEFGPFDNLEDAEIRFWQISRDRPPYEKEPLMEARTVSFTSWEPSRERRPPG